MSNTTESDKIITSEYQDGYMDAVREVTDVLANLVQNAGSVEQVTSDLVAFIVGNEVILAGGTAAEAHNAANAIDALFAAAGV